MFGREFPQKKCGGISFQTYASTAYQQYLCFKIQFFVKWRNAQFFLYCLWFFPEIRVGQQIFALVKGSFEPLKIRIFY